MLNPIQMYQCEYCKKFFKTPNRHICKFDPKFKNCHSYKNCRGFKEERVEDYYCYAGHHSSADILYPICSIKASEAEECSAKDMVEYGYRMNCEKYEHCGGRWVDYVNDNDLELEKGTQNEKGKSIGLFD